MHGLSPLIIVWVRFATNLMNNYYNPNENNPGTSHENRNENPGSNSQNNHYFYGQGQGTYYGRPPQPQYQPPKNSGSAALGVIIVGLLAVLLFTAIAGFLVFLYRGYNSFVDVKPIESTASANEPDKTVPQQSTVPAEDPVTPGVGIDPRFNLEDIARPAPQDGKKLLSIPEIVDKAKPASVAIYTNVTVDRGEYFGLVESTVAGSGFIITENGYIVTNAHVIEGARSVHVYLEDDRTYEASVVGADRLADVAVLKVNATGLPTVQLGDSGKLLVGEIAIAIGNPTGKLRGTVTSGIVSALEREMSESPIPLIQTDAALNSGNSGGALLNAYGEVIGINQLKIVFADPGKQEPIQGISFAIPINAAKTIIQSLIQTGKHEWPMMGITVSTVQEELAGKQGLHYPGVVVVSLEPNGPGSKAGLQAGDVITKIGGKDVTTTRQLSNAKNEYKVGEAVVLTIYRGERVMEVTLVFGSSR